jgi:hypothetical protein
VGDIVGGRRPFSHCFCDAKRTRSNGHDATGLPSRCCWLPSVDLASATAEAMTAMQYSPTLSRLTDYALGGAARTLGNYQVELRSETVERFSHDGP